MNHHCHCNHQPDQRQHEEPAFGYPLSPMRAMSRISNWGEVYGTNYDLRSGDYLVWKLCPHVGLVSRHVGYPASWRLTCTSYFMRGQYWEKR